MALAFASGQADLDSLIALRLRIRELGNRPERAVRSSASGVLHSPFRGRGMEYAESRLYSAGDDARHIDWRVSARSGQLHSKLFHPERDRISAVLYHASPLLRFGTRRCFKSAQAAQLAALFFWLAHAEGDRCVVAACGERRDQLPPLEGRRGVLRALQQLVDWQQPAAAGGQTVAAALDRLGRLLRPGSHLLLTTDAHAIDDDVLRACRRLRRHHDLIVALLTDPIELQMAQPGRYPISDGSQIGWLELPDQAAVAHWQQHFRALHGQAYEALQRSGVGAACIATSDDPVPALRQLLHGVRLGAAA